MQYIMYLKNYILVYMMPWFRKLKNSDSSYLWSKTCPINDL